MSRLDSNAHTHTSTSDPLVLADGVGSGPVYLPEGVDVYSAEFSKVADNLVLQGDNGRSIIVVDYFKNAELPDLKAPDEGTFRGELVQKLAGALDGRLAQTGVADGEIPIGQVETVEGSARVQRTDGSTDQLAVGVKIYQNDVLITDADGGLSVTFADETIFTLSSNSRMVVDELIYDPDSNENSGAFSLIQGGFVFVAGQVAKTGGMTVETPAATMGIRGTNVSVRIVSVNGDTWLALNPDWDGSISSIDVFVGGVLQGTLIAIDEQWIVSASDGTIVQEPRTIGADDQALIDEAFDAFLSLQTRLGAGEQAVNQDSQDGADQTAPPSDDDFNQLPEAPPPEDTPVPQDQNDTQDEGGIDDTQLRDGGEQLDNLRNPSDAPVANDVVVTGLEDASPTDPIEGVLLVSAEPGDTLLFEIVTGPTNGMAQLNDAGGFSYVPNANFSGTDSFTYSVTNGIDEVDTATVTVNVAPLNDPPEASIDAARTTEDQSVVIDPLANDLDVDGDTLTITSVTTPANGTASINADGTLTYTPDANYFGNDSFDYTISDGEGSEATATVFVTVVLENDAPQSGEDVVATNEDQPVTFDPLANDGDADGDTLLLASVGNPSNGTVVINADNTVTYTPDPNFNGTDSFTYTVVDGQGASDTTTATINVGLVNDVPVAAPDVANVAEDTPITFDPRVNDSDADGDPVTITAVSDPANGTVSINADGTLTYTPAPNFSGVDTFTYTIEDGQGGSSSAAVTIAVDFVNDAPVAVDDSANTVEDQPLTFDPRANDSDGDGDSLLITQTSAPANGSVVINIDGSLTYSPAADFNGTDSFTYTIQDGRGGSATATVDVVVAPVNDAPVAVVDVAATDEDTPVTFDPRDNDGDPDGDPLTITTVSDPANGSVSINADGSLTYTPDPNFDGIDSFTYTVDDGQGGTSTATVTVAVAFVNDVPVAVGDAVTTAEDQALTFDPRGNDIDDDGDTLLITQTSTPANGSVVINVDGSLTYTPDLDFSGADSFTYTIDDGRGGVSTATVDVVVTPVNDPPVTTVDAASTDEDVPVTFDPRDNDIDPDGDPLTISATSDPANGSVAINPNGTLTYTPDPNYNGTDSFTYTVTDGQGGSATETVSVFIGLVNDPPVAADDAITTDEDVAVTFDPLGNDVDLDGDPLTISAAGTPTNGSVAINGDGTLTYTPDADFSGSDSFTYTISDGQGATDTATVTVTIAAVNDLPVAADDAATTDEDVAVTFAPLGNDTDTDGDPLTITGTTVPSNGTVAINADGTLTYTPNANFNGSDTFTYTVNDGQGGTDTATVTITVNPVNDAPLAQDDTATVDEDASVAIAVLDNDSDIDADTLTVTGTSTPGNGTVVINGGTGLTYTPNANFNGTDSFTYTISDGQGGTDTATVSVTVDSVNDAPVAADDTVSTDEDVAITFDPRGNDTDIDGDALTITGASVPASGSVVINTDGTLTYTPNADFNGTDSFTYTVSDGLGGTDTATVTVNVTAVNDAPVALDDSATVNEDTAIDIAVLGNDTDVDGDPLSVTTASTPTNGSTVVNADNTVTYTPDANFNGADSFSYTVSDGQGGTATATVTVTVNSVNDLPVAADDGATVAEDSSITIAVLGNDTDVDADTLTVTANSAPANGSAVINADNTITYSPNVNFNGTDSFTYTINDGNGGIDTATVTVTVTPGNDAPAATDDTATVNEDGSVNIDALANDGDIDGDVVTITSASTPANGTVTVDSGGTGLTYSPNANFNGTDSFTYTISDGNGGTDTASVTVTVNAVNDVPVAVADNVDTDEDTAIVINALSNDSDVDGDSLNITAQSGASNGVVAINTAGTALTYTPNANFLGTDTFTYTISDGNGGSDTATVTVTVNSVNDVPVATDDSVTTNEDTPTTVAVLSNDTDVDGDTLVISSASNGANGQVVVNNGTTVTYTPNADFNGADTFTYTVSDGNGGSDTATVTVTVTPVNDAPVAADDGATTNEDVAVTINALTNDSDVDGDSLSIISATDGSDGTVQINGGNTLTYTPDASFNGTDTFTYTISDGNGGSDTATVTVNVTAVNDSPVAVDDSASTNEDTAVTINALTNDSDVDNDPLTITAFAPAANGQVVINNGASLTYTPNPDFNGSDSFSYTVSDGNGGTDTATVTVTIAAVNDNPVAVDDTDNVDENQSVTIAVLANDTDVDGDSLTVSANTGPSDGTVVYNSNNTVTYTPDDNFNGGDSFTYSVSDGKGGTDTATVSITVNSVNDAPVAEPDLLITQQGSQGSIDVTANDFDIDGDNLTVSSASASSGSVSTSGGTITYNPNGGFFGLDTVNYTVSDGNGGTDTSTVTVVVEQAALPPNTPVSVTYTQGTSPSNPGSFDVNISSVQATDINVVFALDSSGSITQSGWDTEKAAVKSVLTTLRDDFAGAQTDVFVTLISFSDIVQTVGPVNLVDNFSALDTALSPDSNSGSLQFRGSTTNWEAALNAAASSFTSGEPNILYFITDGNPVPANQDWEGALANLGNGVDIEAFAVGPNVTLSNLQTIDSDGSVTEVSKTAALQAAFEENPLFNTKLVDYTLSLNVDGQGETVIATAPAQFNSNGLNFNFDLADFTDPSDLGDINVFALTTTFDLDGDLTDDTDEFDVFTVGTLTNSGSGVLSMVSNSSSSDGSLIPLTMTLDVNGGDPSAPGDVGTQLTGVLNLAPNGGDLPSVGSGGSGTSSMTGPTGFGDTMSGILSGLGLDGTEAQSLPTA